MVSNTTTIRVRYGETDKMGIVHHMSYLLYFEVGRTELLRDFGITYRQLEESGIILPVIEAGCRYYAPAYYDDELQVITEQHEPPGVKIRFDYSVFNESKKLLCKGHTILVFTDAVKRRPVRPPEFLVDLYHKMSKS